MLNTPKNIFRQDKRISRTLTVELKKENAKQARDQLMLLQRQFFLPEGVSFSQTRIRTQAEEVANILYAAGLSVMFIYLLMGFLFESFILPLSIICTIPLGAIGVSWIHYLTGKDLDFLGLVGAILLIGVVVNNGVDSRKRRYLGRPERVRKRDAATTTPVDIQFQSLEDNRSASARRSRGSILPFRTGFAPTSKSSTARRTTCPWTNTC